MLKRVLMLVLALAVIPSAAFASTSGTVKDEKSDYKYTVKLHDSLWKISQKLKINFPALLKVNGQIKNFDLIYPNQVINLPHGKHHAPQKPVPTPKPTKPVPSKPEVSIGTESQQVIDLTNKERTKRGLSPLVADKTLSKVAKVKADDMKGHDVLSHNSATYGSPFDMMNQFGITYKTAGENIAKGQRTPQEVVTAWMNSQGHRENILNPNFTHIGVGLSDGEFYWSQMFIGN